MSPLLAQGRYEQAQQLITSVLTMVQRSGDIVGESYALHSLGLIHGRMRMFAEAGRLLRQRQVADHVREPDEDKQGAHERKPLARHVVVHVVEQDHVEVAAHQDPVACGGGQGHQRPGRMTPLRHRGRLGWLDAGEVARLEAEGLVVRVPHAGYRIPPQITRHRFEDMLEEPLRELRRMLDVLAVQPPDEVVEDAAGPAHQRGRCKMPAGHTARGSP